MEIVQDIKREGDGEGEDLGVEVAWEVENNKNKDTSIFPKGDGCISWSPGGLLAYPSSPRPGKNGLFCYDICIVHVNHPTEIHIIKAGHNSPIKFLEWGPASPSTDGSSLLLSCDRSSMINIWEKQSNISEWVCIKKFEQFLGGSVPVCLRWGARRGGGEREGEGKGAGGVKKENVGGREVIVIKDEPEDAMIVDGNNNNNNENNDNGKLAAVFDAMQGNTWLQGSVLSFIIIFRNGMLVFFLKHQIKEDWRLMYTKLAVGKNIVAADVISDGPCQTRIGTTPQGAMVREKWNPFSCAVALENGTVIHTFHLEVEGRSCQLHLRKAERISCSSSTFSMKKITSILLAKEKASVSLFASALRSNGSCFLKKWTRTGAIDTVDRKRKLSSVEVSHFVPSHQVSTHFTLKDSRDTYVKLCEMGGLLVVVTPHFSQLYDLSNLNLLKKNFSKNLCAVCSSPNSFCLGILKKNGNISVVTPLPSFQIDKSGPQGLMQAPLMLYLGKSGHCFFEGPTTDVPSLIRALIKKIGDCSVCWFEWDCTLFIHSLADNFLKNKIASLPHSSLLRQESIFSSIAKSQGEFYCRLLISLEKSEWEMKKKTKTPLSAFAPPPSPSSPLSPSNPSPFSSFSSPSSPSSPFATFHRLKNKLCESMKGLESTFVSQQVKEMAEYLESSVLSCLIYDPEQRSHHALSGPFLPSPFDVLEKVLGGGESLEHTAFVFSSMKIGLLYSLFAITMDLCTFFFKAIHHFLETFNESPPPTPTPSPSPSPASLIQTFKDITPNLDYFAHIFNSYSVIFEPILGVTPVVTLLFDLNFLLRLRRLLVLSLVVKDVLSKAQNIPDYFPKENTFSVDNTRHMYNFLTAISVGMSKTIYKHSSLFREESLWKNCDSPAPILSNPTYKTSFLQLLKSTRDEIYPSCSMKVLRSLPSGSMDLLGGMRLLYLLPCPGGVIPVVDYDKMMEAASSQDSGTEFALHIQKLSTSSSLHSPLAPTPLPPPPPRPPLLDCLTWSPLKLPLKSSSVPLKGRPSSTSSSTTPSPPPTPSYSCCVSCGRIHCFAPTSTHLPAVLWMDPRQTAIGVWWKRACPFCGGLWRPVTLESE